MPVQSVEGFYYSAFLGNGETGFFGYNPASGQHEQVLTSTGEVFYAYRQVFHAFGETLIVGSAQNGGSAATGTEVYRFLENGTVELFADVRNGPESSFLQSVSGYGSFGSTQYFIGRARFDSTTYENVYVTEDGAVGRLADLPSNAVPSLSGTPSTLYQGQAVVLTGAHGEQQLPHIFDEITGTLTPLGTVPDLSGDYTFGKIDNLGGKLYAAVTIAPYNHQLRVLNDQQEWVAVSDAIPGNFTGAPSHQFSTIDYHFFLANTGATGTELFRLNKDGSGNLELVTNTTSPSSNSFYGLFDFEFNGNVYFYSNLGNLGGRLFTIGNFGNMESVASLIPGAETTSFGLLVDVTQSRVFKFSAGFDSGQPHYILKNGILTEFQLPAGELYKIEFLNGSVFASMTLADGGFSIWAMSTDGEWQHIAQYAGTSGTQRIVYMSHNISGEENEEFVLMDDGDNLITSANTGSIIMAEGGDDTVIGGVGRDKIFGGDGNDVITGGAGSDTLNGGDDHDTFRLWTSASGELDVVNGQNGEDTADFSGFGAAVWVDLDYGGLEAWTKDDGNARNAGPWRAIADFTGVENITGTAYEDFLGGDAGANNLSGGAGSDELQGEGGNDTLMGGAGSDIMLGGSGDDTFLLSTSLSGDVDFMDGADGAGGDTVDFSGFGSAVWIWLAYSGTTAWTKDTSEAIEVAGPWRGIANMTGIDHVTGTAYDDWIAGDSGGNILNGGGGNDRFVFHDGHGFDRINGFEATNDAEKIDLSAISAITDFNDLRDNHMSIQNGEVVIDTGTGQISLTSVSLSDLLDGNDFIF